MSSLNKPLISIGIPTYNRADGYLEEALKSAISQTYENIEIIVADNSSTDHTEDIVKKFKDSRIIYFKHNRNIGANNNFNFCLKKASGAYFLLLHDDDLIDSDFVETCIKKVNFQTNIGVIRTGTRIINAKGEVKYSKKNRAESGNTTQFIKDLVISKKILLYLCSALFHRQELLNIGGFQSPANLLQDNVAEIILTEKLGRCDIPDIKASFRRHNENRGSADTIANWAHDSIYVIDIIKKYVDNQHIVNEAITSYSIWNYNRARRLDLFSDRWKSYWLNYKIFNYRVSPAYFFYRTHVKSYLKKIIPNEILQFKSWQYRD